MYEAFDGMRVYRAIVSYSASATGVVQVRIPSVLGNEQTLEVSQVGRVATSPGAWSVPAVGEQVLIAVENERFSNIYLIYPQASGIDEASFIKNQTFNNKGELITASANDTPFLLSLGSQNAVLTVDTATTSGIKWSSTLTGITASSPVLNYPEVNYSQLKSPHETWNTVSTWPATVPFNIDSVTSTNWYYSATSTGNWTMNFRGNDSTTLNSTLSDGESITFVIIFVMGSTAYRPTSFSVDGIGVTPRWQGGVAPSAGNANSNDVYTFSILKIGNQQFRMYASQTRFA